MLTLLLVHLMLNPQLSQAQDLPLELDTTMGEYLIPGEREATQQLMTLFATHMRNKYERTGAPAKRAVHAKEHACVNGEFEVFDHGVEALKYGVFRAPKISNAFLRFSNGDGPPVDDGDAMVSIGMAVKVFDVEIPKLLDADLERAQDFLLINQPAFLVRDVVQFTWLVHAREGSAFDRFIFGLWNKGSVFFRHSASPKDNPLNTGYWSGLPFRLGDGAVKYSAQPCRKLPFSEVDRDRPNFLSELLNERISASGACFNFYLQQRVFNGRQEIEMPIENARTIWNESAHPPVRVAQIRIPRRAVDDAEHKQRCERSQFNPWVTTHDFIPLGSLNRARRPVYELSAKQRHRLNQTTAPGPENR